MLDNQGCGYKSSCFYRIRIRILKKQSDSVLPLKMYKVGIRFFSRVGSGSGFSRGSDPDPDNVKPDPHLLLQIIPYLPFSSSIIFQQFIISRVRKDLFSYTAHKKTDKQTNV